MLFPTKSFLSSP